MPFANTEAMQAHLNEISLAVAPRAHAVLLMDRAGWHITAELNMPENITPVLLPSRAPELNPVENIWQYLRQNYLSNRVFDDYDEIVDAACKAWNCIAPGSLDISLSQAAGLSDVVASHARRA